MIYGETTNKFTLMAGCDRVYLYQHAKSLVVTAALAKNNLHLHVTNPLEEDLKYLETLKNGYSMLSSSTVMTTSYDTIDISNLSDLERKTFYSCVRFIVAPEVVKGDVLIVDVDCFILKKINNFDVDVGLFFRKDKRTDYVDPFWKVKVKRLMAGIVYVNYKHMDFLHFVRDFIQTNERRWYADQVGLIKAHKAFKDKKYLLFGPEYLDWYMNPGSYIWTGKASLKRTKTYQDKIAYYNNMFPIKEEI